MKKQLFLLVLISLFLNLPIFGQEHAPAKKRTFPKNLTQGELNVARLYEKVIPTVVTIYTTTDNFDQKGPAQNKGLGSGVLISKDSHILTAAHVIDGSSQIMVKTQDGKLRKASILFSEKSADLALLQLDEPDTSLSHAVLGDSDQLAVGQNAYAIGSPYGLENSFSAGIVSAFRGFNTLYDGAVHIEFIQTDAAINSGNSGGPLFNSQGEVIGIASRILTVSGGFQGIGMAVTINTAKDLLAFENRPWIGVESVFLQKEELSKIFNLNLSGGLLIQQVAKGSPAQKAGLRGGYITAEVSGKKILLGGDIILQIAAQETCHVNCLENSRQQITDDSKINIRYLREGKEYTTVVDVSETRRNFLSSN